MSDPAPLVGTTAFGERYELAIMQNPGPLAASSPPCVLLEVRCTADSPSDSLRLTPAEARALAADLVTWAGHAEGEGKAR